MKWIIAILLIWFGVASAEIPDYLAPVSSDVVPYPTARVGQPIAAVMVLERIGTVPEEAWLNITAEVESPRIEARIDEDYKVYGLKKVRIPLPEDVKSIELRITGYAPRVDKLTEIKVLDVKTYVRYKGAEPVYQEDGTLTLDVSTKEIIEAVIAMDEAMERLRDAEKAINELKAKGVNTVELEADIVSAKEKIERAKTEHDKGDIENAKYLAGLAKSDLDEIISRAEEMGAGPAPVDIKRYLTIGIAVLVVILVAIFIRRRREELG
jgi:hypothetical protein